MSEKANVHVDGTTARRVWAMVKKDIDDLGEKTDTKDETDAIIIRLEKILGWMRL